MVELLLSSVCDRCEGASAPEPHRGYIVWRARPNGSCEYVFKTVRDAEKWRAAAGLDAKPIRVVLSPEPFHWRQSTGSVRDIELADRLFEVYPDATHTPGPNRVHLEPA